MPRVNKIDPEVLKQANDEVRKLIRMEMVRRDLTYADLAKLLNDAGIEENERNLRNKIARGEFSAPFMLMCLNVMGTEGYQGAGDIIRNFLVGKQAEEKMKRSRGE